MKLRGIPNTDERELRRYRQFLYDLSWGSLINYSHYSNPGVGAPRIAANWIKNQGWFGNVTLGNVEFGYEITSSSGGLNFDTNSYSVTSN